MARDRSVAARTASSNALRSPLASSRATPASVVPPGDVTWARSVDGLFARLDQQSTRPGHRLDGQGPAHLRGRAPPGRRRRSAPRPPGRCRPVPIPTVPWPHPGSPPPAARLVRPSRGSPRPNPCRPRPLRSRRPGPRHRRRPGPGCSAWPGPRPPSGPSQDSRLANRTPAMIERTRGVPVAATARQAASASPGLTATTAPSAATGVAVAVTPGRLPADALRRPSSVSTTHMADGSHRRTAGHRRAGSPSVRPL